LIAISEADPTRPVLLPSALEKLPRQLFGFATRNMSEDNISAAPLPEVTTPEPRPETDIVPDVKDTAGANDSDVVASAPEPEKEVAPEVSAEVADGMFAFLFSHSSPYSIQFADSYRSLFSSCDRHYKQRPSL